jgi:glycogen(starch) synthase
MLSWEYPPRNIGGLSNHVYNLSHALKDRGHEVYVITCIEGNAPKDEVDQGVYVRRVSPYKIETEDFVKWVMHLNYAMIEEGIKLIDEIGEVEIIHAHDWLTTYAAKVLMLSYRITMLSTIHSTEYGRNNGIRTEMQRYISAAENMLIKESSKIIVCSKFMKQQVMDTFGIKADRIKIIPNGVEMKKITASSNLGEFRKKFAEDSEKIVFFIGRHVFEKGIHVLIEAIPRILREYEKVKFVIAGSGPMSEELKELSMNLGLDSKVSFAGYLGDTDKSKLYQVADIAVFPSLYEPFGIVALEAMVSGCPVVVSDTGGLNEIIQHKKNGLKATTGSSESIAENILELLENNKLRERLKIAAIKKVKENYTWDSVAELTENLYIEIKS